MPEIFDVPVAGAYHLVHWLASATEPLTGSFAAAAAIVLFTVAVRLLLVPFARAAARGQQARTALAPEIRKLQEKHGKNREKLAAEMAKLQQESGTSMFVGCLPMLAQLPFFWVMYHLFSTAVISGAPNALLGSTLFGITLGAHGLAAAPVVFVVAGLLAVVAWFSIRWQDRQRDLTAPGARFLRLLPYGTVAVTAFVPLAASLYLLTTTTWTVVERAVLYRVG
ncbi:MULTISPECIES: membrane protein insertase YidC [unclassified Amycolatopsis]|uniref:YidC/Oxa1 family membrane protein insertase n=1 Tax=unclassified Amycolatopsis TaxID=2618356 RepID=UPI001C69F4C1|nr:membrane protein insertase YidC [Amycolatopsis sp. DSM 110486]QYN22365.1 YidC/Oxa1 family membrane protein insertase [Amycolatopsis sp. DSM 110486]